MIDSTEMFHHTWELRDSMNYISVIIVSLYILLQFIGVVKIHKKEYSSRFVRYNTFFPIEPVNTGHLTESDHQKITKLAVISAIFDVVGFVLFVLSTFHPNIIYMLIALLIWNLPSLFLRKRLGQYLNPQESANNG